MPYWVFHPVRRRAGANEFNVNTYMRYDPVQQLCTCMYRLIQSFLFSTWKVIVSILQNMDVWRIPNAHAREYPRFLIMVLTTRVMKKSRNTGACVMKVSRNFKKVTSKTWLISLQRTRPRVRHFPPHHARRAAFVTWKTLTSHSS